MTDSFRPDYQEEEGFLPEQEPQEETAVSRLQASPEEEAQQERLRLVDQLLKKAPLVKPSVELAGRVVEAIRRQYIINPITAIGMAFGMGSALLIAIILILSVLLGFLAIILNWTAIYQWLVKAAGTVPYGIDVLFSDLSQFIIDSPWLLALSILAIPLLTVWIWIMRRLRLKGISL
jgi:hypothetical protein